MTAIADQRARLEELTTPSAPHHKTITTEPTVGREGTFEALVASFDTVDRAGDIIRPGAFKASLERWRKSGNRIPIVWSHETRNPNLVIGSADPHRARETSDGLVLHGRLNIDHSAVADHVYDLLAEKDISGWSFGYRVLKERRTSKGNELLELDLLEAGPTPVPANDAAGTISVKGKPVAGEDEEDKPPSHTEVERRLIEAGVISRPADAQRIYDQAFSSMRDLLQPNGDDQEKTADAYVEHKSSKPITVATLEIE